MNDKYTELTFKEQDCTVPVASCTSSYFNHKLCNKYCTLTIIIPPDPDPLLWVGSLGTNSWALMPD